MSRLRSATSAWPIFSTLSFCRNLPVIVRTSSAGDSASASPSRAQVIRPSRRRADGEPRPPYGRGDPRADEQINRSFKTAFIFSTHDTRVIAKADRLVRVNDDEIRALGVRSEAKWAFAPNSLSIDAGTN